MRILNHLTITDIASGIGIAVGTVLLVAKALFCIFALPLCIAFIYVMAAGQ